MSQRTGIARILPDVGHETSRIQIAGLNSTLMVVYLSAGMEMVIC